MKNLTMDQIDTAFSNNYWDFGNKVLYDLCENNFHHKEDGKILAKVWLIGRAYSASIERQKHPDLHISTDEYYINYISKNLKDVVFDNKLDILKEFDNITETNLPQIIETHHYLMNKLTITINGKAEKDRRSFCSKYLHFHLPNLYFIYDSRAVSAIRYFQEKPSNHLYKKLNGIGDDEYANFFCRCYELKNNIYKKFNKKLTTRQLDNVLLNYEASTSKS